MLESKFFDQHYEFYLSGTNPYEILREGRAALETMGRYLVPWHLACAECGKALQFSQWQHWRSDQPDIKRFGWCVVNGKVMCPEHSEEKK